MRTPEFKEPRPDLHKKVQMFGEALETVKHIGVLEARELISLLTQEQRGILSGLSASLTAYEERGGAV